LTLVLSEERDQLQEILEGLRQEKQQLKAELEDRIEMIATIQEKLSGQEQMQTEREKQEAKLQQQLLSEANPTILSLSEQLCTLDQNTSKIMSSKLQESTEQLQESFKIFQHFIDTCSKYNCESLDEALRGQGSSKQHHVTSFPQPTMNAYSAVCQQQLQTVVNLGDIAEHLQLRAKHYWKLFEELVKTDLAVFEKWHQDVLLRRAQAPKYSVKDENFHALWGNRLTELLNRRQLYLQKMDSIIETLRDNMKCLPSELASELKERVRLKEQVQAVFTEWPVSYSRLDAILNTELEHRSAVAHSRKMILQDIISEQDGVCEELKLLQAQSQLSEERSKNSTLLKALEGAPPKEELSLLKDNQQLLLQLQQTEEMVKNKQLEEAEIKANNRVSNHKEATQLLQTELQDKENTIQTLKSKLRESEKNAAPSSVQLEELRTKLFQMEVQSTSASDKHQQEIQRMTTLLNEKYDSLTRLLKEALRKAQQQEEESSKLWLCSA
ncbi:hypothetical protein Q5P01_000594, partial [Channa striata]